jgi:hypothetical protein
MARSIAIATICILSMRTGVQGPWRPRLDSKRPAPMRYINNPEAMNSFLAPENDVFVSYSHKDREQVLADIEYLSQNGLKIWYDKEIKLVYPRRRRRRRRILLRRR